MVYWNMENNEDKSGGIVFQRPQSWNVNKSFIHLELKELNKPNEEEKHWNAHTQQNTFYFST